MPLPRNPADAPADPDEIGDELPPLDGDEDEEASQQDASLEDLDAAEDASVDFDDAAFGEDTTDDFSLGTVDGPVLAEGEEASDLDIGASEIAFSESALHLDDQDEGAAEGDVDTLGDESGFELDHGEEGPDDFEDEVDDGSLPRLDADEEGELDDASVMDPAPVAAEAVQHPWDDRAWRRVGVPLRVGPLHAVVPVFDGALAAGRVLASVARTGACVLPEADGLDGAPLVAVAGGDTTVLVATRDGRTFLSKDGGATFADRGGWVPLLRRPVAEPVAAVALAGATPWVLANTGQLFQGADGPEPRAAARGAGPWHEPFAPARFLALATGEGPSVLGWVAPSAGEGSRVTAVAAREGRKPTVGPLPPLPRGVHLAPGVPFAWRGGRAAFIAPGIGAYRLEAAEEGPRWALLDGTADATALVYCDDDGTLLIAVHGELEERSWLLRVRSDGTTRIVAEVGGEGEDPDGARVDGLAWDDAADVVWLAGSFGLVACAPT